MRGHTLEDIREMSESGDPIRVTRAQIEAEMDRQEFEEEYRAEVWRNLGEHATYDAFVVLVEMGW